MHDGGRVMRRSRKGEDMTRTIALAQLGARDMLARRGRDGSAARHPASCKGHYWLAVPGVGETCTACGAQCSRNSTGAIIEFACPEAEGCDEEHVTFGATIGEAVAARSARACR